MSEKVLQAQLKAMINHRGKEFEVLFREVSQEIKKVFQTKNDVLIFPAAGTGVMKAAIVNLFSPGDKLLAFPNGVLVKDLFLLLRLLELRLRPYLFNGVNQWIQILSKKES